MALQPFWARLAAALPCVRAMAAFADVKEALLTFEVSFRSSNRGRRIEP